MVQGLFSMQRDVGLNFNLIHALKRVKLFYGKGFMKNKCCYTGKIMQVWLDMRTDKMMTARQNKIVCGLNELILK